MKKSRPPCDLAQAESRRQTRLPARGSGTNANRSVQDPNALIQSLAYLTRWARLPQPLQDPAWWATHLDQLRRQADDAARLAHRVGRSCGHFQSKNYPAAHGRSLSIPVSRWREVAFKANLHLHGSDFDPVPAPATPLHFEA